MTVPRSLFGAMDGPEVQASWPGRRCDVCRALSLPRPKLANHKRNHPGGGNDLYCDEHLPRDERERPRAVE